MLRSRLFCSSLFNGKTDSRRLRRNDRCIVGSCSLLQKNYSRLAVRHLFDWHENVSPKTPVTFPRLPPSSPLVANTAGIVVEIIPVYWTGRFAPMTIGLAIEVLMHSVGYFKKQSPWPLSRQPGGLRLLFLELDWVFHGLSFLRDYTQKDDSATILKDSLRRTPAIASNFGIP